MRNKTLNNKIDILISNIIIDRDFDVPDWLYEYINESVISKLIDILVSNDNCIVARYRLEEKVRNFFDKINKRIVFSQDFIKYIFDNGLINYGLLLFGKKEFRLYHSIYLDNDDHYNKSLIYLLCKYVILDDIFINIGEFISNNIIKDKKYIITMAKEIILKSGRDEEIPLANQIHMDRLLKIMKVNESYELTQLCISYNIPVFFKYGDEVDLEIYLQCLIDSKWKSSIDCNLTNIVYIGDNIVDMLWEIANKLNMNALVYIKKLCPTINNDTEFVPKVIDIFKMKECVKVNNFKTIIDIIGKNPYGLPITIQKLFISFGGDIKTMFDNGKLLKEATIIREPEECSFLINNIPIEDLKFLLYNSPEFVKNILSISYSSINDFMKILKALCEYPLNVDLWNVLNNAENKYNKDFRLRIFSHICKYVDINIIYDYVPEVILYRTPSIFYITSNINNDIVKYVSVEKLIPYVRSIISRNNYIKFNFFCNGKYISLTNLIPNLDELIRNVILYKKYGYICDIIDVDPHKLLSIIYKYI